jgi:hypothetical protein
MPGFAESVLQQARGLLELIAPKDRTRIVVLGLGAAVLCFLAYMVFSPPKPVGGTASQAASSANCTASVNGNTAIGNSISIATNCAR